MATEISAGAAAGEAIHVWEAGGAASAEALAAWVGARLAAHEDALSRLLAVEGERTPANSLLHYDTAIEQLTLAGAQAGILNSVAADKAVRDQAQMEAQRVAMAGSALSLNRPVYDALVAMKLDGASAATKHYRGADAAGLSAGRRGQGRSDAASGCTRCTTRRRSFRSHSAATSRRAERRLRRRPASWRDCRRITLHGIRHQKGEDGGSE